MPKPRHINADPNAHSLHSPLGAATSPVREVAWIVEHRIVWPGADLFRALFEAIRTPFEQLAWHVERRLLWPLQERTEGWSPAMRIGGTAVAALLIGAIVVAVALSGSSSRPSNAVLVRSAVPAVAAQTSKSPAPAPAPAETLHGAPPLFTSAPADGKTARATAKAPPEKTASTPTAHASSVAPAAEPSTPATSAAPGEVAGKAALSAARDFSKAFVLYETGKTDAEVRATFHETATPQMVAELLHRPPRMPANVEVPQAKVVNVVPGPQLGDNSTVSVSLLRVGVTSELRLSMHRTKNGTWLVNHALG